MSTKVAESFSNKISSILCSAPETFDPEDEVDDTVARVVTEEVDSFDDIDTSGASNLRKQNITLLDNEDQRYLGKAESRKQIFDKDQWEGESNAEDTEDQDDASDNVDEEDDDDDASEAASGSSDHSGNEEDPDSSNDDDSEIAADDEQQFKQFEDSSDQTKKGSCVRNQLSLWENLLEIRIQLQKCLLTANKMPQSDYYNELASAGDEDFQTSANECKNSIVNVLDKFLLLQSLLFRKYPETKHLLSESRSDSKDLNGDTEKNNDEEIGSDEEIPSNAESEEENEVDEPPKKKLKLGDYGAEICNRFEAYRSYRNSVIHKWNDKTRIASNKPGNAGHSVTSQIEHILSDKEKLVKRTQQKRLEYEILGEIEDEQPTENENQYAPTYNTNIFDDTDFYHQLLRELIEFKSSDITDPIQLGQQWMKLQSMRSKMKRKIDTSATKGRKVKYVVHSKIVNFMAPIEQITWQDNAKSELYNSLFNKNVVQDAT